MSLDNLDQLISEVNNLSAKDAKEAEELRIKYLGQKGIIKQLFNEFKNVPGEQKKLYGQKLNLYKRKLEEKIAELKQSAEKSQEQTQLVNDITRPAFPFPLGTRHPIAIVKNQIIEIFSRIGFNVSEGPEIEDDFHNFTALNFPQEHPARDMQDTFFVHKNPDFALRTHTSSVQVRVMESQKPPIRTISPGRVYRNEAISARAHCIFHQVEGLYIDKGVSFADLKQTLLYFAKEMFGEKTQIRLRPSYFPFTEPSAEVDVSCSICAGKGCNVCKYTGFLEIMGCGMVDPNVLENCGIDSNMYSGYAFGMGIERIAMLQ
ncbi:MAG: phenylalanine--tRNA ligase subunit alpha, partial [Bacteroidetes bacterium]